MRRAAEALAIGDATANERGRHPDDHVGEIIGGAGPIGLGAQHHGRCKGFERAVAIELRAARYALRREEEDELFGGVEFGVEPRALDALMLRLTGADLQEVELDLVEPPAKMRLVYSERLHRIVHLAEKFAPL